MLGIGSLASKLRLTREINDGEETNPSTVVVGLAMVCYHTFRIVE